MSEYVDRCKAEEAAAGECYGGMSRLYTKVQEMRDTEENFLLFNAGDYYSGTVWSDQFQFEPSNYISPKVYTSKKNNV